MPEDEHFSVSAQSCTQFLCMLSALHKYAYSPDNLSMNIREPLKTHLREKELLAPTASSSLLTLRGLPGSGEVSSLRDRGADRQTSTLSEPFLAFGAIISFSLFKAVFRGTLK